MIQTTIYKSVDKRYLEYINTVRHTFSGQKQLDVMIQTNI